MTVRLHIASIPALAVLGMLSGPSAVSAEEVSDGLLQTAAYDVIIVPREARASRSRIWTGQGWSTLSSQRGETAYERRTRTARTWDDPRAGQRARPWTYTPRNGTYPRTDRAWADDGRRRAQQEAPRPTWRPRYAEGLY